MQRIRHLLFRLTPEFLLVAIRKRLKEWRRKKLKVQESKGEGLTAEQLTEIFSKAGIKKGDALLVHASLSKIGFVKGGVSTLFAALENCVGRDGTLLMPAFPAEGRNLDYILKHPFFDSRNTPSRMGALSEYFRSAEGTFRSLHPTDSVCAKGKDAAWFTQGHEKLLHPYEAGSPFRKLCDRKGKILMLGTTLNGACTNLHTLEDAVENFMYPVYMPQPYTVEITDEKGIRSTMKTYVHNPEMSAKRNADALKPMFIREQVLTEFRTGNAACMLIDADKMLQVMRRNYFEKGITMYTPEGGPLP